MEHIGKGIALIASIFAAAYGMLYIANSLSGIGWWDVVGLFLIW